MTTSPSSIPEAAVEAAVYAYGIDGKVHEWERKMILNILEAAAPHFLAQGWAEDWAAAQAYELAPNPYRAQS